MLKSPLFQSLLLLFIALLFGVAGFYLVEPDYSLFDALYMTVITLSTVGYSEVGALSENGRVFAIVFIIIGIVVFAISIRLIGEYLLEEWGDNKWKQKKNKKRMDTLKEHTIVCGFGRNGRQAVNRLKRHHYPYVIIEQDANMISTHEQDIVFYKGDALSDASLKAVHIEKAKYLICALPNDADNLFVVLSARQLNPKLVIVSRVSEEVNQSKLELAGADHIIQPDKIGGDYMAALLTVPNWIHFLGKLDWWGDEDSPNIEEISLDALPQRFQNKTLSEMSFFKTAGCNVIGYRDKHGKQLVNPDASLSLSTKGTLIVLGTTESIKKLNAIFKRD